ncbi:MAG: MXAN_6640 family putative metalloprotease [Nocardioides sp.]
MRRSLAAALVAASMALSVAPAATSSAEGGKATPPLAASGRALVERQATRALATARSVMAGTASPGKEARGTLALRDLYAALPHLDATQRKQAHGILARPTDGSNDPYGDGYTVASKRRCQGNFCIHWVPTTSDAPPSTAWVTKTLATMNKVWHHHVVTMGYRKPLPDLNRGGNSKIDVYLKDVGAKGLYGYCAPERPKAGTRKFLATGYCVLDNDFAESQFGAKPVNSLKVTAAHEFFHAIQFAYDYAEDSWFMEATATWMEERYADDVNDNRQYLPYSQVKRPGSQLDFFNSNGFNQYGNWTFFEYLSSHYGNKVVRSIWDKAGAFKGAPDLYSIKAVKAVLAHHGGLTKVFGAYASGNTVPSRSYPEGSAYPSALVAHRWTLGSKSRQRHASFTIDHLASQNAVVTPGPSLKGTRWAARFTVDAPGHRTSPTVVLLVRKTNGRLVRQTMHLSDGGFGKVKLGFSHASVRSVTVTLANVSTRFKCWRRPATAYSCSGKPLDNNRSFSLKVAAYKR